MEDTLQDALKA